MADFCSSELSGTRSRSASRILVLLLILLSLAISTNFATAETSAEIDADDKSDTEVEVSPRKVSRSRAFFGLSVFDMKLDIDSMNNINGPTHFFSSRHRMWAGGRMTFHSSTPTDKSFYIGKFFGFGWGKNSFLINWETEGVTSYDPLEADITFGYFPFGFDFNLVVADFLHISALTSVKWMFHKMNLEIDNTDFDGKSSKIVGTLGGMASIDIGNLMLTVGASMNHYINSEIEWEVSDLTFESEHTKPSIEYFVGVVLQ